MKLPANGLVQPSLDEKRDLAVASPSTELRQQASTDEAVEVDGRVVDPMGHEPELRLWDHPSKQPNGFARVLALREWFRSTPRYSGAVRQGAIEDEPTMRMARKEAMQLLSLGWPQSVSVLLNFAPRVVVLAAVGHFCDGVSVAATGVGIMYSNFCGNMLLKGSAFGSTPLLSQAFGASNHARIGQLLHRMMLIHALVVLCITLPFTLLAFRILSSTGQPRQISELAADFIWWRLAAIPFVSLTQNLTNFLVAQRCVRAPMVSNMACSALQCALAPFFVSRFGFIGAPLAMITVECTQGISLFLLSPLLLPHKAASWPRWCTRAAWLSACRGWGELVLFGVSAAMMVCSEWLGWECTLLLAGHLCARPPHAVAVDAAAEAAAEAAAAEASCAPLEAVPIATTVLVCQFLCTFGFGLAACNRIGNLLGAGRSVEARCCARVAVALIALIAASLATVLVSLRHAIAGSFVDEPHVVELTASLMRMTIMYAALANMGPGCAQQIFFGVGASLRVPAAINTVAFFIIGIPLGAVFAFELDFGVVGLWGGLVVAMVLLLAGQYTYMYKTVDWAQAATVAVEKALGGGKAVGALPRPTEEGEGDHAAAGVKAADSGTNSDEFGAKFAPIAGTKELGMQCDHMALTTKPGESGGGRRIAPDSDADSV